MNWGTGTTYSTFAMASPRACACAMSELESLGYRCTLDETDGQLVVDVDHPLESAAAVRCLVLRADPSACVIRH